MRFNLTDREKFQRGYITAALWSSTYGENGESNLDDGEHDLAEETREIMQREAGALYDAHRDIIGACEDRDAERAGHDFWLTRNGHGAGFWDGDWPEPHATTLDNAAKAAGERDLYVGDDGLIYQG